MADYIERDKVLDAVLQLPPKMDEQGYGWLGRMGVWQMIRDFQSADVAPVVHGQWKSKDNLLLPYSCSVCGVSQWNISMFCPDCGAKMDGET